MNWNARTILRLFLLGGGSLLLVSGAIDGQFLEVVIGIAAVALGAVGLASEWIGRTE